MASPGQITRQIIEELITSDLVIADLTDHNPNVFYELAIRHATRKPVVQITHTKDIIPFDVANQRTISYDHTSLTLSHRAKAALIEQIKAAERNPGDVDSPLTEAILSTQLDQSQDPVAKNNVQIIDSLLSIRRELGIMKDQISNMQGLNTYAHGSLYSYPASWTSNMPPGISNWKPLGSSGLSEQVLKGLIEATSPQDEFIKIDKRQVEYIRELVSGKPHSATHLSQENDVPTK